MSAIPKSFTKYERSLIQRALNERAGCVLTIDGDFGPKSINALKIFQMKTGLAGTGIYDMATQTVLQPFIDYRYLTEEDYTEAAKQLNVSRVTIKAVVQVESVGAGFLPDGSCKMLFERHKFYTCLSRKRSAVEIQRLVHDHPKIINKESGGYSDGEKEHRRLKQAILIDEDCALRSSSWGMFQIMGFSYRLAGYQSVKEFVEAMKVNERNHLHAFVRFIQADDDLHKALQNWDWATFARLYNGPKYAEHNYDKRLALAFDGFKKQEKLE